MKKLLVMMTSFVISFSSLAGEMNANELFKAGLKLRNEKSVQSPSGAGGLIQRHPLLNHSRGLFVGGAKVPAGLDLEPGKTWTCLQFTGLDFQSDIMEITKSRSLSFEDFGAGIIKEVSYGNNQIKLYANDEGELAGINTSGELYEAMRVTAAGDLILESSIQGLGWWKTFFTSLIGGGRNITKLLKIVQKAMLFSVSNSKNDGLVFDYTICPRNKLIDGVARD